MFTINGDEIWFEGYKVGALATGIPATIRQQAQAALEDGPQELIEAARTEGYEEGYDSGFDHRAEAAGA